MLVALLLSLPCLLAPVEAPVVDPFRPPACTWCPGNRGLEYATRPGVAVRAPMTGRVSFAGVVAGTRYVVIEQDVDGQRVRVTLGDLADSDLRAGDAVSLGATVGTTTARLHLGVRVGDDYVDPGPLLATDVRRRARLVPLDGQRRLPGLAPVIECPAGGPRRWETSGRVR